MDDSGCIIPKILQGSWFSWEVGLPTLTVIDATSMTRRGNCLDMTKQRGDEYSFVFKERAANCYHCVRVLVRTLNVFEKFEGIWFIYYCWNILKNCIFVYYLGACVSLPPEVEANVENVCRNLRDDQQLVTLFNENFVPINCRSSLEGVWHFTYQVS